MATGGNPFVQKRLVEQITCSICLECYTDPRTLPCLHSFCKGCIDNLIDAQENRRSIRKLSLTCPQCRKQTLIGKDGFPPAFELNKLLDLHNCMRQTSPMCQQHTGKRQEIFCETCEALICLSCTTEHSQHKYSFVSEAFPTQVQQITNALDPFKKLVDELETVLGQFDQRAEEIKLQGEAVKEEIAREAQRIIDMTNESKKKLTSKVISVVDKKVLANNSQKKHSHTALESLKSRRKLVEDELKAQSEFQLLAAKKQLIEHIHSMYSQVQMSELVPHQTPDITFVKSQQVTDSLKLGEARATMNYSSPGLFSVHIPQHVIVAQPTNVLIEAQFPCTAEQLMYEFRSPDHTVLSTGLALEVGRNQFTLSILPTLRCKRPYQLRLRVENIEIHGSPFLFRVVSLSSARSKVLKRFANGILNPIGMMVNRSGDRIVVLQEDDGNHNYRITVLDQNGKVVKSFCKQISELPLIAVHIFISSVNEIVLAIAYGRFNCKVNRYSMDGEFIESVKVHASSKDVGSAFNLGFTPCQTFHFKCGKFQKVAIGTDGEVYSVVNNTLRKGTTKFWSFMQSKFFGQGIQEALDMCIDGDDILYVNDRDSVKLYTSDFDCICKIDTYKGSQITPRGVTVDLAGNLYIYNQATSELLISPALD